jgi:hypothetical protein
VKIWKLTLGVVLLPILLVGGCAARAWQRDRVAKQFCESLIPQIERARAQNGQYPAQADPAWWAGQSVPPLIRTERFYFVRGSSFRFWFQNDSWVFDNVWDFSSGSRTWSSYDANYEKR